MPVRREESDSPPRARPRFWFNHLPLLVFLLSLAFTCGMWRVSANHLRQQAEIGFHNRSAKIIARLKEQLHDQEQVLLGGLALFKISPAISPADWRQYVATLNLGNTQPGILGIGYAAWLAPSEKSAQVERVRREGFPEFTIRPAGERANYAVVTHLEPLTERNQRAFGFDLYSEPTRRQALDQAISSGRTTITGKIILVREKEEGIQNGILLILPLFPLGLPTSTPEERRLACQGFIFSPIRMTNFVSVAIAGQAKEIGFEILDEDSDLPDKRLYSNLEEVIPPKLGNYQPEFTGTEQLDIFGHRWTISFRTLPGLPPEQKRNESTLILLGGLLLSLLLTTISFVLQTTREKALALTESMASEINERKNTEKVLAQSLAETHQLAEALRLNNLELDAQRQNQEQTYRDLKFAQTQLLQTEKMASIGLLAAGVAHEINNPVGFITSNLGSLAKYLDKLHEFMTAQEQHLPPPANAELQPLRQKLKIDYIIQDTKELIAESLAGAESVSRIVRNLKSFSRVDSLEAQEADINDCLETTLNIVWNELKYKATVTKEYGELPRISCFPQELNQAFMNLLVNAAQAIESQGEIRIKSWQEADWIAIAISDTGEGIPLENQSKLFEPFFTTKPVGKGTGLGLSIVYEIVKKHNGRITVVSAPGQGATFTIQLPTGAGIAG